MAKVVDVVLFGSDMASDESLKDVSLENNSAVVGLTSSADASGVNSNETLYVVLSVVGVALLTLTIVLLASKKARYKVGRFFSEMFAGIFGKKKYKG